MHQGRPPREGVRAGAWYMSPMRRALLALALSIVSCRHEASETRGASPGSSAVAMPSATASAVPSSRAPVAEARAALSDRDFGRLVASLSEPAGKFPSDNFVSNETSWAHVLPALDDPRLHGGGYVGVGPEQSFSYLAVLRPELAFVIDIRRQNVIEHLVYKTLFERATSRADFLARLCARKTASDVPAADATIEQLAGWVQRLPKGETPSRAVVERAAELGVELSKDDLAHLDATTKAFADKCLALRYSMEGSARKYPSLGELLEVRDAAGKARSFLASEDAFRAVAELERENRIVPLTGDLAGDGAMPRLAAELRARSLELHVLYASNVEQYLFSPPAVWKRWTRNVAAMPWADGGRILRVYFDQGRKHPAQVDGHRTVSMLAPADHFLARAGGKGFASWWDVATSD